MAGKVIVKAKCRCSICGCNLRRQKTIKVAASTPKDAQREISGVVEEWKTTLTDQQCKICNDILMATVSGVVNQRKRKEQDHAK